MLMAHGRRAHVGARLAGDGDGRARDRAGEGGESGRGRVRSGPLAWHMGQTRPARSMARSGAGPHVAVRHTLPNTDSILISSRDSIFSIHDRRREGQRTLVLFLFRVFVRGRRGAAEARGRGAARWAAARATRQRRNALRGSRQPQPARRTGAAPGAEPAS